LLLVQITFDSILPQLPQELYFMLLIDRSRVMYLSLITNILSLS